MAERRRVPTSHVAPYRHRQERGPNGRRLCRYCSAEVPVGRQTWCSDACVTEALVRAGDPTAVSRAVLARDHGICSLCGADAEQTERVIGSLHRGRYLHPTAQDTEVLIREQWGRHRHGGVRQLWEADHITPVAEGGGGCGLDGYRTLCVPCHRRESKALAGRLGLARRHQRPLLPEEAA